MYSAIDLSKYIVSKCIVDDCPISNLQLQEILFYIQEESLRYGKIAFPDNIEAWSFGPVVPNVFYHYCGFGAMPISIVKDTFMIEPLDAIFTDQIIEEKRRLEPWNLIACSHRVNGAWAKTYNNGKGNRHIISPELIRKEEKI